VKILLLLFLLAALILSACSPALATPSPSKPAPGAEKPGITDPAKPIEASAGSEFTIAVRVDRPPEYHWEVAEALDPKIIGSVRKEYVPDDPNNDNSKGRVVWHFKALAPGKTTITLGYYQGMSEDAAEKPVFTVIVK
jgi:predicted secreted protein